MVLVEGFYEVVAKIVHPKRLSDASKVLLEVLLTKRYPEEPAEPRNDVVLKPVAIDDGDDVIGIGSERRKWNSGEIILQCGALIGEN